MAWEISITPEGWAEIYEQLENWESRDLAQAICDDEMEAQGMGLDEMKDYEQVRMPFLEALPHYILVDKAYELIGQNNTPATTAGGAYWVDRQGCHRVSLD